MEVKKLSEEDFKAQLQEREMDWNVRENGVEKSFEFSDFIQAFQFMGKIAIIAEKLKHHPDWTNVYNKVFIRFTTHHAGGLTEKDMNMIVEIDKITN